MWRRSGGGRVRAAMIAARQNGRPHVGRRRQRRRALRVSVKGERLVVREQLEIGRVDRRQTVQTLHGLGVRGLDLRGRATKQCGLAAVIVVGVVVAVSEEGGRRGRRGGYGAGACHFGLDFSVHILRARDYERKRNPIHKQDPFCELQIHQPDECQCCVLTIIFKLPRNSAQTHPRRHIQKRDVQHIGRAGHHAGDQTHELRIGLDDHAQLVDLVRAVDVPQVHAEVVHVGDRDKDAHDAVVRRAPRLGCVGAAAARVDARREHGVGGAVAHEQLRVTAPRVGRVERVRAQVSRAKGERVRERRVRGSAVRGGGVVALRAPSVRRAEIGAREVEYGEQQAVQHDKVARVRSGEALRRGKLEQRGKYTHGRDHNFIGTLGGWRRRRSSARSVRHTRINWSLNASQAVAVQQFCTGQFGAVRGAIQRN